MTSEYFMKEALKEAQKAYKKKETPIGAVAVYHNKIIARAHNQRETKRNAISHAEVLVINRACKKLKSWRLDEVIIYVTLEPCIMCAGAMIQARIKEVVYGAKNLRFGAHTGPLNLFNAEYNHFVQIQSGVLESECKTILSNFFKELRNK
ncbi:MAG: tRNA adenosine(34) deaminase TadA [Anaeroplasmataceae bacterium]|nr:tRNA adenosine(34) deaminase TadA [Anaeroplasmataceae bacterium]